ncbi:CLUMA_CG001160, isoform A [Clunio marinus]|uniref:CLUMA_CG001160, isoform A n=1 Tax=Clunio marinus TaxID=568069 RepID=A0A1J1HLM6_9DIPT|nr:CLUMA_CG001160, isoform A [Clunio marinus]
MSSKSRTLVLIIKYLHNYPLKNAYSVNEFEMNNEDIESYQLILKQIVKTNNAKPFSSVF